MAAKPLPSPELLRQLLRYEPETGKLFWRKRPSSFFKGGKQTPEHNAAIWNGKYAGKEALACHDSDHYCHGHIFNQKADAHRVIWTMLVGPITSGEIDHINGIRHDNRLCNLRNVPRAENTKNACVRKDNISGITGVKRRVGGKWLAVITSNGKVIHLGCFDHIEDAARARKAAERTLGFHPNHGRPRSST